MFQTCSQSSAWLTSTIGGIPVDAPLINSAIRSCWNSSKFSDKAARYFYDLFGKFGLARHLWNIGWHFSKLTFEGCALDVPGNESPAYHRKSRVCWNVFTQRVGRWQAEVVHEWWSLCTWKFRQQAEGTFTGSSKGLEWLWISEDWAERFVPSGKERTHHSRFLIHPFVVLFDAVCSKFSSVAINLMLILQ